MRSPVLRRQGRHPAREAALLPTLAAAAAALSLLSGSAAALADEENDACVGSYESSQQLRRTSDLVRTKAELRLCLGACPRALARDCERWLKEVEPQLGRVKAEVRDAGGGAFEGARLTIDGLPARANADGELEVNPGTHVIRAEATGMEPAEQEITVTKGGRASVELTLARTPAPPPPPPPPPAVIERSPPIAGYILGGVGLAGLATGGVLTLLGHLERSELRDSCAPLCAEADVEAVRRLWIAGGISAGVGAIALGVGIGLIASHPGKDDEEAALRPVIHLGRGAAGLGLAGRF